MPSRAEKKEGEKGCFVTWTRASENKASAGESKLEEMGSDVFDTVLCATGREPCTKDLHLCCARVMRTAQGKIATFREQTSQPNIYALGDCAAIDRVAVPLELTPVAIQAGKLLADRLYGGSSIQMDYTNVATCVFTPIEYGCVGLTEEQAIAEFGESKVEVYHQVFQPLEFALPKLAENTIGPSCYCKVVCNMAQNARVVGFHFLAPHAGEVTQGVALAMRKGVTKEDLDACVGIHPTVAEIFTTLTVSKGSGKSAVKEDC